MITLISGLNGAGKSLHLVSEFPKRYEGRQFYYHRFKNKSLPWIELKAPEDWVNCPPNSVIVLDEAQEYWGKRDGKTPSQPSVDKLPVHRADYGVDFIIITPDPSFLDIDVRRLVTEHIHLERKFNAEFSHMWTFPRCITDPYDNTEAKSQAVGGIFKFPKENYGLYESAPVHTMKRRIPWKAWAFIPALALVGYCAYAAYDVLIGSKHSALNDAPAENALPPAPVSLPSSGPGSQSIRTPADYLKSRTPLIDGLPHTAPAYLEVTAPVRAPIPAACIASSSRCRCYSQDATSLDIPEGLCRQIADKGYFVDWQKEPMQTFRPAPNPADTPPLQPIAQES